MNHNGAKLLVTLLESRGVTMIAGMPGGSNLPLYDALRSSTIRHISVRHEQGAGFIAEGIARVSDLPGVCLATSGPGATNLLTALADAKKDSIPLIAITGQVSSGLIGSDAFQEIDICSMAEPVTKKQYRVMKPEELYTVIPDAFRAATGQRKGPVLIDIPVDVQLAPVQDGIEIEPDRDPLPLSPVSPLLFEPIARMIESSRRPLLYIGGGILHSSASEEMRRFARHHRIPVVSTLMGLGAMDGDDPLFLGMLGVYGTRTANLAIDEADCVIAAGVRFDDRATGDIDEFCRNAKIIHIDIDPAEINRLKACDLSLVCDAKEAFSRFNEIVKPVKRDEWRETVRELSRESRALRESFDPGDPRQIPLLVSDLLSPEEILVTDVGQHQMWVAQSYPFRRPKTLLTSGGLGAMGFGLPVAIGAALARPDRTVVLISGDGSFLLNLQELATLRECEANVKIIILNNRHLGLVRQQQTLFFRRNLYASRIESPSDFTTIAEGFGIPAFAVREDDPVRPALEAVLYEKGPALVDVMIDPERMVWPVVPSGAAIREMIEREPPLRV